MPIRNTKNRTNDAGDLNYLILVREITLFGDDESISGYTLFFTSNTFISNTRLRLAYFETKISENNKIWTMRPFQNDCTHSK